MFNLEEAIKEWRKQLEKHQGLEPGDVEELESNLWDKIERYTREGLTEEEAFHKATKNQFESVEELASEFYRARSTSGAVPPWKRKNAIYALLPNIVKVAFRNLSRNKMYALINISGLSIGIACFLVLLGYVMHELSYDQFHANSDRIYRVDMMSKNQDQENTSAMITAAVGPSMVAELPEVEKVVRFSNFHSGFFSTDAHTVKSDHITYADSTIFSIFSFDLQMGNESKALSKPNSVIVSKDLAKKLFPEVNPINKTITINGEDELLITGILNDLPSNSQLKFSAVISFNSLYSKNLFLDWNGGWSYYTYILLSDHADIQSLKNKFPPFMYRHINKQLEEVGISWHPRLQPLTDIHLYSNATGELETKGSLTNIYLFSSIAFIILILACINFTNLTTVQASSRSKEIGIRKVLGSGKKGLAAQFMFESGTYVFICLIVAVAILLYNKPRIDQIIGTDLLELYLGNAHILAFTFGILLLTTLIAGAYPALYLSSMQPVDALKQKVTLSGGPVSLIKTLVVFQFAVSILLIAGTLIVTRQLTFIKDHELGYNKENVIVLPMISDTLQNNYELLKQQIKALPGVLTAAGSSEVPGNGFTSNGYFPEGYKEPIMIHVLDVDPDYLETMKINIVQGRNFNDELQSDKSKYLVNQSLVEKLNWRDPIGKTIRRGGEHEIIGVVQDFNFATLHKPIEPLIITAIPWHNQFSFLSVRISGSGISSTLDEIHSTWQEIAPEEPFEYYFLDQSFDAFYQREQVIGKIFLYFSIVTIIIGCMGLFGLVSYSVKKRTKEFGIRKVLGATSRQIFLLVGRYFFSLILISFIVAVPVAFYLMNLWLREFTYTVNIGFTEFLISGLIIFMVALLTISYHSVKMAGENPIKNLRME